MKQITQDLLNSGYTVAIIEGKKQESAGSTLIKLLFGQPKTEVEVRASWAPAKVDFEAMVKQSESISEMM